jgi:hypothetical protein
MMGRHQDARARMARAKVRLARGDFGVPSPAEIEAARGPRGGWSSGTSAEWGVPWPPPAGWRDWLGREWARSNGSPLPRDRAPRPPDPNFPAYVTDGATPDGTLRVRVFQTRQEADAAGFEWVGR